MNRLLRFNPEPFETDSELESAVREGNAAGGPEREGEFEFGRSRGQARYGRSKAVRTQKAYAKPTKAKTPLPPGLMKRDFIKPAKLSPKLPFLPLKSLRFRFPTLPLVRSGWPLLPIAERPPEKPEPPEPRGAGRPGGEPSGGPPPEQEPREAPSEYIRWVQSCLNQVMGLRLPLDGIMSPATRSAVRSFQERRGLPVDGLIGPPTEAALVAACAGTPQPTADQESESDQEWETVEMDLSGQQGEQGEEQEMGRTGPDYVRWIQESLNKILDLRLVVDGIMGARTRSAIRSFQQRQGLVANGIVGANTENALRSALQQSLVTSAPPGNAPSATRLRFQDAAMRSDWREAFLNLNGLNMYEMLRALDELPPARRSELINERPSFRNMVNMPRIEYAITVVQTGQLPPSAPDDLAVTGQVQTAEEFLRERRLRVSANSFLVGRVGFVPPAGLNVTNYLDPRVQRFRNQIRRSQVVNEFVVHETVTRSVTETVAVLNQRRLGVHLIMGPKGEITQHGDLREDLLWHASQHNPLSVGIEVVNPYYPKFLKSGMPWTQVIPASWAHEGRYVVPTPQQAEALCQLILWITSPSARGLSIPRTSIGLSGNTLAMGRTAGADKLRPGIYAHTYFGHADGAWLVLYAYLRIEKGRAPNQAYAEAIQLATTRAGSIAVG